MRTCNVCAICWQAVSHYSFCLRLIQKPEHIIITKPIDMQKAKQNAVFKCLALCSHAPDWYRLPNSWRSLLIAFDVQLYSRSTHSVLSVRVLWLVCWQRAFTTSSSVPTGAAVSQHRGSVTVTTTVETCPTNRTAASPHRRPVRTIRQSPSASCCFALHSTSE